MVSVRALSNGASKTEKNDKRLAKTLTQEMDSKSRNGVIKVAKLEIKNANARIQEAKETINDQREIIRHAKKMVSLSSFLVI